MKYQIWEKSILCILGVKSIITEGGSLSWPIMVLEVEELFCLDELKRRFRNKLFAKQAEEICGIKTKMEMVGDYNG